MPRSGTSWATVLKGLKWMLQADAPLLVNPTPTWHKLSLDGRVHRQHPALRGQHRRDRAPGASRRARTCCEMARARRHRLRPARIAASCTSTDDKKDFDARRRVNGAARQGRAGAARGDARGDPRDRAGAARRPITAASSRRATATGDIHKFTTRPGRRLRAARGRDAPRRRGLSVTAHESRRRRIGSRSSRSRTTAPPTEGHRSTASWSAPASPAASSRAALGDRVNIYPVKGYSITVSYLTKPTRTAAPWVSLLDDATKIVTSRLGPDRFRVAGTAEFNGYNRDIRADRIQPLVDWCEQHFPAISTEQPCLGGPAADDAGHAAAGRPRQASAACSTTPATAISAGRSPPPPRMRCRPWWWHGRTRRDE